MSERATLVVPCFDEEQRIDRAGFLSLLDDPQLDLLLVDDGSRDRTGEVLRGIAEQKPGRVTFLGLPENRGKAEAVRQGLLRALAGGASIVGYADADLATPPAELRRLVGLLRASEAQVLIGSRVALMGREVSRRPLRHYLGRLFATAASLTLRAEIYDTQCGAKWFRDNPSLRAALAEPFASRWVFDVELLGRLLTGGGGVPALPVSAFVEEPVTVWRDVAGSKLGGRQMVGAAIDLAKIRGELTRRRNTS